MIIRVVKMEFLPENIPAFEAIFEQRKETIRGFEGCNHLELWQDANNPCIFFTYSMWNSEADLNHYRFSSFFKETWSLTKALFGGKAEAWSVVKRSVGVV